MNPSTEGPDTATDTPPEIKAALRLVESVAQALLTGRAPRGRKPLRDAIRLFRQSGLLEDAFRGQCLLAELEFRQDELERALTAARAALRLAEQHLNDTWLDASLELLARLNAAAGQHARAQEHARERVQRARRRGEGLTTLSALLELVRISWQAGDTETAIHTAEEAVEEAARSEDAEASSRAEQVLGTLLLRTGCPCAAYHCFTAALRNPASPDSRIRLLLSRGSASMCLGNYDSAARDFRRALRDTKAHPDQRLEVGTTAALAAAEAARGHEESNAARLAKAAKLAERAARRSRRLRDSDLERKVDVAQATAARGEEALAGAAQLPRSPREAAGALVALAKETMSETVVAACRREVEWLATLGQQARPYRCDFHVPFLPGL